MASATTPHLHDLLKTLIVKKPGADPAVFKIRIINPDTDSKMSLKLPGDLVKRNIVENKASRWDKQKKSGITSQKPSKEGRHIQSYPLKNTIVHHQ